jgi:hypothetical protein
MGKKSGREPLHAPFLREQKAFCENGIVKANLAIKFWSDTELSARICFQHDETENAIRNRGKAEGTLSTYTILLEMLNEELNTPAPAGAQTLPLLDGAEQQTEIDHGF